MRNIVALFIFFPVVLIAEIYPSYIYIHAEPDPDPKLRDRKLTPVMSTQMRQLTGKMLIPSSRIRLLDTLGHGKICNTAYHSELYVICYVYFSHQENLGLYTRPICCLKYNWIANHHTVPYLRQWLWKHWKVYIYIYICIKITHCGCILVDKFYSNFRILWWWGDW